MIVTTVTTIFIFGLHLVSRQRPNCDFYQQILPGKTYMINSPRWPRRYSGMACRWIADCPIGYRCRLTCPKIVIPKSPQCWQDHLLVSQTGNTQLTNGRKYCGRGSLNVLSNNTRISMGLITAPWSKGGKFACKITAEARPPPTCRCGDKRKAGYYKKRRIKKLCAPSAIMPGLKHFSFIDEIDPRMNTDPNFNEIDVGPEKPRKVRIVGGDKTRINEYPSMVAIADVRISEIECGGVIISPRHVLTTAHCVIKGPASNYAVIVGEHDIRIGDSPATKAYRISYITPHPWYTDTNYDYDISILTLTKAIVYNRAVGPVCMPFKFLNSNLTGIKVTMLGWGTLWPGGPSPSTLHQVEVDVITQKNCRDLVPALTDRQICTYTPGKDACQNDSGGPLLYKDPASKRLFSVGIISYGRFCASGYPGINTRLTSLMNWIVQNTPGADYCTIQ